MALNENAQKWVDALRSGEFTQCKRKLHDGSGYCCLGVACEVYHRETGLGYWGHYGSSFAFNGGTAFLPPTVRAWLGLAEVGGKYREDSLTGLNDNGYSFAKIADIIESEPEGLFVETN